MPQEQRFTLDDVAELYDRARPQYQDAFFNDVISLFGFRAGGWVLEVGCGTGQATLPLARCGFRAVRQAIEMHGGRIEVEYEAHLYVASRAAC